MPLLIPIDPVPAQRFNVTLDGQKVTLTLRQVGRGMFLDLAVNGDDVLDGAICEHNTPIPFMEMTRFHGCFVFEDSLGNQAPEYNGLSTRWKLYYFDKAEKWKLSLKRN